MSPSTSCLHFHSGTPEGELQAVLQRCNNGDIRSLVLFNQHKSDEETYIPCSSWFTRQIQLKLTTRCMKIPYSAEIEGLERLWWCMWIVCVCERDNSGHVYFGLQPHSLLACKPWNLLGWKSGHLAEYIPLSPLSVREARWCRSPNSSRLASMRRV